MKLFGVLAIFACLTIWNLLPLNIKNTNEDIFIHDMYNKPIAISS